MQRKPRIAVIGAGLGGTAAASFLQKAGYSVKLYEQAPGFSRISAGIHPGPKVMKVMRKMGIEDVPNALGSHNNTWLRDSKNPGWCFGHDVVNVPPKEPRKIATAYNGLATLGLN